MGKMKDIHIELSDIVEDTYLFGDFHDSDSFAQAVFKECKNRKIPIAYKDAVKQLMKEALDI